MYSVKSEHKQHKKLLKSLAKHFTKDEKEMKDEEDQYPHEYYNKKEVKENKKEKFYPPYDEEGDEYEEDQENSSSPWKWEDESTEGGNYAEKACGSTHSKGCGRAEREVERVPEALEKHRAPKSQRKKMAVIIIAKKMRKRNRE